MQYMKLSTSRDFRINAATLDAALQEQDDSQVVSASSAPQELQYCSTYTTASSLHFYFIIRVHKTDSISTLFPRLKCARSLMLWMLWAKSRSFFPSTPSLCLFVCLCSSIALRPQSHRTPPRHKNPNRRRGNSEVILGTTATHTHTRPDCSSGWTESCQLYVWNKSCLVHKELSPFV